MITVKEMYQQSSAANEMLLSTFNAPFWEEYKSNYKQYDKIFYRLYRSFYYFEQESNEAPIVQADFTDAVYGHLLLNKKKYTELFKVHLHENGLSLDENYKIVESYSGSDNNSATANYGSRTDSSSSSENIGAKNDSVTTTIGEIKTTESTKHGKHTDVLSADTSPYDSESFFNKERNTNEYGEQTNSDTSTVEEHSDSTVNSFGSQNNTTTAQNTKGASSDSSESNSTKSYEKTTSGFNGNGNPIDMIKAHSLFWNYYDFYRKIFDEIAKEFLCV